MFRSASQIGALRKEIVLSPWAGRNWIVRDVVHQRSMNGMESICLPCRGLESWWELAAWSWVMMRGEEAEALKFFAVLLAIGGGANACGACKLGPSLDLLLSQTSV